MTNYGQPLPFYQSMRESLYLTEMQYRLQEEAIRNYMASSLSSITQARTNVKDWVRTLREDYNQNENRIQQLAMTIENSGPTPKQDSQLMSIELHLRRALIEVLRQRMNTEAAKQQ